MMTDYRQHRYEILLEYIDKGRQQFGEEADFAEYLLSMEEAPSINNLIKIYNTIYQLLIAVRLNTRKVPKGWYTPYLWGTKHEYNIELLNQYLNENILRWFVKQAAPTADQCRCCLANLRVCNNIESVYYKILCNSIYKEEIAKENIIIKINYHYSNRIEYIKNYSGKAYLLKRYIDNSKFLAAYGRIFDVSEIAFGKENGVSYENFAEEYRNNLIQNEQIALAREAKQKSLKSRIKRTFKGSSTVLTSEAVDELGDLAFSVAAAIPIGLFGGIISAAGIGRRGRRR